MSNRPLTSHDIHFQICQKTTFEKLNHLIKQFYKELRSPNFSFL